MMTSVTLLLMLGGAQAADGVDASSNAVVERRRQG